MLEKQKNARREVIAISLEPSVVKRLKTRAERKNQSVSRMAETILRKALAREAIVS